MQTGFEDKLNWHRNPTLKELRVTISSKSLRFNDDCMWVELDDDHTLGIPLTWFPRLLHATKAQHEDYELSRQGMHWDAIDEDISVAGLLAGQRNMTHPKRVVA